MKKNPLFWSLVYYIVGLPLVGWTLAPLPGIAPLARSLRSNQPWWWAVMLLIVGFALAELGRQLLVRAGWRRCVDNSRLPDKRRYRITQQLQSVIIGVLAAVVAALFLLGSPYRHVGQGVLGAAAGVLRWIWPEGADVPSFLKWLLASAALAIGFLALARPLWPMKPPGHKTYHLEMFNPFLVRWALFSPERFMMRYLRKLGRRDYLNRFNRNTLFAGRISTLHEGQESVWYVTFDERKLYAEPSERMLTAEHFRQLLDSLKRLECVKQEDDAVVRISHDIVADVAREHGLAARADRPGADDEYTGDLTGREVDALVAALGRSGYDNVLTLDVDDLESERSQQTFNKRLDGIVRKAGLSAMRRGGVFELNIHRRDRRLMTKVLHFRVDAQEMLRKSFDEYGERLSVGRSLLYATIRGAAGEHGDVGDPGGDFDGVAGDADEEAEGGASASTLDHVEEINPSVRQVVVGGKGFGRVYDIQLGKESYQVITEWFKSLGVVAFTGWRPLRKSKVIDSDGKLAARRLQRVSDMLPHLMGVIGLGKEYSHVEIRNAVLQGNDKLPLALLALDVFEARGFTHRRRILKSAPKTESERPDPEG